MSDVEIYTAMYFIFCFCFIYIFLVFAMRYYTGLKFRGYY